MTNLDKTLKPIQAYQPENREEDAQTRAAVAIIFREGQNGSEFLMIQRAFHEKDTWSGQMAFPGGKIDPEDASPKSAAIRETHEEVAIILSDEDYVGQIDDCFGIKINGRYRVQVSCFVFKLNGPVSPVGNEEVEELIWVPVSWLNDPARKKKVVHPLDETVSFAGINLFEEKNQVIWGLSLRMIISLSKLINLPLNVFNAADFKRLIEHEMNGINLAK